MVRENRVRAVALAIAMLGTVGVTAPSTSLTQVTAPSTSLAQTAPRTRLDRVLVNEGVAPGSISSRIVRPNGTLDNGLLPEQWGDTA